MGGGGWSDGVGVGRRLVGGATNIPREYSKIGSIYIYIYDFPQFAY